MDEAMTSCHIKSFPIWPHLLWPHLFFSLLSASLHAQCMQFIVVYKSACSVHASHFCVVLKPLELANCHWS